MEEFLNKNCFMQKFSEKNTPRLVTKAEEYEKEFGLEMHEP